MREERPTSPAQVAYIQSHADQANAGFAEAEYRRARRDRLHLRTIEIDTEWAKAACIALGRVVVGDDYEDCRTWHGGLGADECEFCCALVVLRQAAGYSPVDHLRP